MTELRKGQRIAIHVLDKHILPLMPKPIPLGGKIDDWEDYWEKCFEIVGPKYTDADIAGAGYFVTEVQESIGDQILFRDSKGEFRLVPADQVITQEQAPKAFEFWLWDRERKQKDHA